MLWSLPEILVIHLKRFTMNRYGEKEANKDVIKFPAVGLELRKD